ncbi:B3/4 domain-containing protein [Lactobacillus sp. LC28-10]|uniref:B3/4 domain-containing protein n=1 Tax=Secundilactobacillus angelensis TaxID=2722706 RepID=A0ABX1L061_9LACO|nr:B3/4 domain-containing protein [Secundilactobacillus angelensis]MCH5461779.1 B3/4 domain-containing protein [Secundilactobacillus angelensis]NLR18618.1 B3/4 domain-containing protein [Secundilactobacillus angelensis]
MTNLVVDSAFWELFPEAQINTLTVHGLDNTVDESQDPHFQALLDEAMEKSHQYLTADVFRENPIVAQWREAYSKFKKKKGARSSIEALLKRVDQGKHLSPINPLVDVYNSVSLEFGVPCGGEDLAAIDGPMHLGVAKGGEAFKPLGVDEDEPALPGEVIYYDKIGAVCRCFNWRDGERTMLTEKTTDAILVIEAINAEQRERQAEAVATMQQRLQAEFSVEAQVDAFTAD